MSKKKKEPCNLVDAWQFLTTESDVSILGDYILYTLMAIDRNAICHSHC